MKRHPAIVQLSRDHHVALAVAQRLRRVVDADAEEARDAFLDFWRTEGLAHFRQEEEVLLPTFARFAPADEPVVGLVLVDHVRIRALAMELAGGIADPRRLHLLGSELEQHVRREERELFPLIEQSVPEPELLRLGALLG